MYSVDAGYSVNESLRVIVTNSKTLRYPSLCNASTTSAQSFAWFDDVTRETIQKWIWKKKQRIIQPILSHLIIYLNSRKNPITNRAYIGNTKCTNIRCGQLLWGWERVLFFFLCVFILPFHLYTQSPFFKMNHTLNMLLVSPLLFHRRLYAHPKITLVFNILLVVCLLVCFCYNFVFIEVDFFLPRTEYWLPLKNCIQKRKAWKSVFRAWSDESRFNVLFWTHADY